MKIYVNVTKDDVKKGRGYTYTGDKCPVGRAINRALHNSGIKGRAEIDWDTTVWLDSQNAGKVPFKVTHESILKPRKFSFEYKG